MGARPDLDLSDILPYYREFMDPSTVGINHVRPRYGEHEEYVEQPMGHEEVIPEHLYERHRKPWMPTTLDPFRVGNGPTVCSTSREMVSARPAFSWDVNGWYRTLGVPFPYVHATSGVLSKAYVASGGQQSPRATYYLKRLLNKAVRAEYDAMPLGEGKFLDDEYVQQEMKARAQAEASRRSRDGSYTKAKDVLDEWGYVVDEDDDPGVDKYRKSRKDRDSPETDAYGPIEWTYSYWLWKTPQVWGSTTRLETWQTLLVSALSEAGHNVGLTVGLMGKQPQDYAVGLFDGHWIVFLNSEREPTQEMAAKAASALMNDMNNPRLITN